MGNMPILINFENRPLLEISFFKKVPVTRHNIDFRWDFFSDSCLSHILASENTWVPQKSRFALPY